MGAAATAVIAKKGIPFVGLTTGGVGYSTAPNVYITNPINPSDCGFEAIFNPKYITRLNSSGVVTSILAEQVGGKYDEFASGAGLPPPVTVDTPIGFSTGSFEFNETVTGQTSGVTGDC